MINVKIFTNRNGDAIGFDVDNHGDPLVCSAVSVLTLNTVNSIECLTQAEFQCDADEDNGGHLSFALINGSGESDKDAILLLNSLKLGLQSIAEQYPEELRFREIISDEIN